DLRPIVADQADVLDQDVVDEPAVALAQHTRLDRHFGLLLGDDLRAHDGVVAVDLLVGELQLLATEQIDLRDVRLLQQLGEQLHEFLALLRRALLPVRAERAARRLLHVEDLRGDLAYGRAPLRLLVVALERRILEHLHDGVRVLAHLVGRRAGPRARAGDGDETEGDDHHGGRSDHECDPSPAQYTVHTAAAGASTGRRS